MNKILILGVVAAIIGLAFEFLSKKSPQEKIKSLYNYKRKDFFMSRPEHEFFDILVEIVGSQYYVFPQVHLDDILDYKVKGQNWKGAFRHIDQKSVDFVICDKAYIKPLLAIELDDRSHEREDRKARDGEVERILSGSDLPLLRFGNNGHFDKEYIKNDLAKKINLSL